MQRRLCLVLSLLLLVVMIPVVAFGAGEKKVKKSSPAFKQATTDQKIQVPITPSGERKKEFASFRARPTKDNPNPSKNYLNPSKDNKVNEFAQDRVIVKFKQKNVQSINELSSKLSLKKLKDLRSINAQLMKITNNASVDDVIKQLKSSGQVEYAEPDFIVQPSAMIPNDPYFGELWGMDNTGTYGTPDVDINAPEAWEISQGSDEVVVAVIDTGMDISHQELADHIWTNPGEIADNGIDDDGNGYVDDVHGWDYWNWDNTVYDPQDGDQHATHVAGTIAASINNNEGVAGIAPNVKIMPLKFIGPYGGYTSDAISALEYAASMGVKISNNSWGGGGYEESLKEAIANSGILFVAAAGNDYQNNNDWYPAYPASYDLPNILSVAACDSYGYLAWFSNYGPTSVDIAAPGVDILSSVPGEPAQGAAVESDNGYSKTVFWGFGLEDMDGQENRVDAMSRALDYLSVTASVSGSVYDNTETDSVSDSVYNKPSTVSVLLVDNDGSEQGWPSCNDFYTSALDQLGIPYTIYDAPAYTDGPSVSEMQAYSAVIWQTGSWNVLSANSMYNLEYYLSYGGKLLLAGQDAIYSYQGENEFAPYYLHAYWLGEGTGRTELNGISGTAYEGAIYNLGGTDSGWGSGSYRDLLSSADAYGYVDLEYPGSGGSYAYYSGTSMATPHATGTAALVLSKNPGTNAETLKKQIMGTAKPLYGWEGLTVTGGMVDAYAALTKEMNDDIPGVEFPEPGQTISGEINEVDDTDDVYSIFVHAGETIAVNLTGDAGTDFDLYIYSPEATTVKSGEGIVAYSDQYNTSNETITYVAPYEGVYYIDVYAYAGAGSYNLNAFWGHGPGLYEESNEAISYVGTWNTVSDPSYSGGNAYVVNSQGNATFNFTSTGVRWMAFKGPDQGIAEVFIDNNSPVSVNLYSTTKLYNQVVFEVKDLPLKTHTIAVRWTGKFSPGAKKSSTCVNLDAISVIDSIPPVAPQNLSADAGVGTVVLNWDANTEGDLAGYNIYRSDLSGESYVKINSNLVSTNTYSDNELPGGTYYYVVTAVDNDGNESVHSQEAEAFVMDIVPPAVPTGLTAAVDNSKVTLSWNANTESDLMGYLVYRSTTSGTGYVLLNNTPIEVTNYVDTGVTNGVTYYYVVEAVDNSSNYSGYSNEVSAKPVIVVGPGTIEDTNAAVLYTAIWSVASSSNYSDGKLHYSNATGAKAQIYFNGTSIKWLALKSPYYGISKVYIDGQLVATVDMYSATNQNKQTVFTSSALSAGVHTIVIERTGTKNSSALSYNTNLDAFVVQ